MNTIIRRLDDRLCFWFCRLKGFVGLIDRIDIDEAAHVMTAERRARAGWTDYQ